MAVGRKLHPTAIRPLGSNPATSFITVLADRLNAYESEIDIIRKRRDWLFQEGVQHGYDRSTIRKAAAERKS